jgi:hypothetical protein
VTAYVIIDGQVVGDVEAWLRDLLADNAKARKKRIRDVPKPSYRQRRAEWAAIGKTGEDAAEAMQRELDRRR